MIFAVYAAADDEISPVDIAARKLHIAAAQIKLNEETTDTREHQEDAEDGKDDAGQTFFADQAADAVDQEYEPDKNAGDPDPSDDRHDGVCGVADAADDAAAGSADASADAAADSAADFTASADAATAAFRATAADSAAADFNGGKLGKQIESGKNAEHSAKKNDHDQKRSENIEPL